MIPKNIHLIFLRKDEPFPELFEKCKQEIQVNHPDWNIRLYNKDDAQDILNQDLPEYIEAYNAFYHNVQKSRLLKISPCIPLWRILYGFRYVKFKAT